MPTDITICPVPLITFEDIAPAAALTSGLTDHALHLGDHVLGLKRYATQSVGYPLGSIQAKHRSGSIAAIAGNRYCAK
jgi:hypothetical protein